MQGREKCACRRGVRTRACRVETLQKPCAADSRRLRDNQLKTKLLRSFAQRSDLLLAILGFVVFVPFVNILLSVLDETVKQAGELSDHNGDRFRGAQPGT